MSKKFTKCPFKECNHVEGCLLYTSDAADGQQLDNNQLVWYHVTTDNRGQKLTHKWSVNSGRPFTLKPSEMDELI